MSKTGMKIILSLFLLFSLSLRAQKKLDSLVIITEGVYQPTVTDAVKINENPFIYDSVPAIPKFNYSIASRKLETAFDVDPIVPARLTGEPLTKLYRAYVKGGVGTYSTSYGELFFNNLRSKDHAFGFHANHLASGSGALKNTGNASFSDNELEVYGKKFLKKHTLSANLDYDRQVLRFYGYDPALWDVLEESTKQRFSFISPHIGVKSHYTDSSKINHEAKVSYYNFSDRFKSAEHNVLVSGGASGYLERELISVNASVDYYNNRTALNKAQNTIINFHPAVLSMGKRWKAGLGLKAVADFAEKSHFHFYPEIDFHYHIIHDILIPYIGITGGLQKNSYRSMTSANPFIIPTHQLKNTDKKYELFGGLRGSLTKSISFNTSASMSEVHSMPLYINDTSEALMNRFIIAYDNVDVIQLHGEFIFQQNEKLRIMAKGDYFKYSMSNEVKPWHKPAFELVLSANYNLKNKIVLKTDIFYLGKQFAKIYTPKNDTGVLQAEAKELKGLADINLGLEYRYNKKLAAFVNFNNIAGGMRYYRWHKYPTQKFNLLAGVSFAF